MAARHPALPGLSQSQREIMEIVWDRGEVSAVEVREILSKKRELAKNTVRTLLDRMEEKGWLKHREEGRTYVYQPTRSREEEGKNSLRKFVDRVFDGDALLLFQHLLEDQDLSTEDLAALKKMIDQRRKEMTHG